MIPIADAGGGLPIQRSSIPVPARSHLAESASARPAGPPSWMSGFESADIDSRFDPSVPHPARIYSYWLGGKDHYPADREAAEQVIRCRPQVVTGARANRAFLARVVRFLAAECGIRQFLDIGTGLPAPHSTHEVAQAIAPDCRIVYVDSGNPLVLVHARALLTSTLEQGSCDDRDGTAFRERFPLSSLERLGRWIRGSPLPCSD